MATCYLWPSAAKRSTAARVKPPPSGDGWLRATCSHPLPSGGQRRESRLPPSGDRWLVRLVAIRCQAVDGGASNASTVWRQVATCDLGSPKAPFRLTRSQRRGTSISPPGCCVWGRKEGANSYRNKPLRIDCPPNPVADAHRHRSAALRAKTKQPDLYGRSTTKEPYARSAPSPPRPSLPQPKPWGPGGAKRFL